MLLFLTANPDMVGHGVIPAAIKAVETVDDCVGQIASACLNTVMIVIVRIMEIVEQLIDFETGEAFTSHTTNIVPLIYVSNEKNVKLMEGGKLCDLAPTMLDILNIKKPEEMTGHSLIIRG